MAKVRISRGKFASINACANGNGIIAAAPGAYEEIEAIVRG